NKRALLDEIIASGYSELGQMMGRGQDVGRMLAAGGKFANLHPNLTLVVLAPRTDDHLPVRRLQTELLRARRPYAPQEAAIYRAQLRGHLSMRQQGAYS